MIKKKLFISLLFFHFFCGFSQKNNNDTTVSQRDSITTQLKKPLKTIIVDSLQENKDYHTDSLYKEDSSVTTKSQVKIQDSLISKDKKAVLIKALKRKKDSLNDRIVKYVSPARAAFLSATVPGLGQIYNKKYWKVPIIYGLLYFLIYQAVQSNNKYEEFRFAYGRRRAGYKDDQFYGPLDDNGQPPEKPLITDETLLSALSTHKQDRDTWITGVIIAYAFNIIDASVDAHLKYYEMNINLSLSPFIKAERTPFSKAINYLGQVGLCLNVNY